jgi:acetolactate synthase-1/2/3 large subunit
VLYVTGQSKTTQTIQGSGIAGLRQFGTFEVDIVPIVRSVTKYATMVTDPRSVRFHLEKAIHLATSGRPGPVLLDMPLDVQGAPIDPDGLEGFQPGSDGAVRPGAADLARAASALRNAARPLIVAGAGVRAAGAVEAFRRFVERLNAPVATTQFGKDAFYYDHPLFVGHPGPRGDRAGNFAVQTADVILSVGCSLHSQTTGWENDLFATDALKIQVDLDEAVLERERVNVGLKIRSGVREFLEAFEPLAGVIPGADAWRRRCLGWKRKFAVNLEPHERSDEAVNYYDFVEALNGALNGDECIVTDAGSAWYVLGQCLRLRPGQRYISSGSLGAMGYALPAANGAAAAPGAGVTVCVTGDGSFMTNVHDLAVTRRYDLDVKLFVLNNDGYLSIRNTQREYCGGLLVGTDPASGVYIPELEAVVKSYGLPFLRCDRPGDVAEVVARALAMKGPVAVEVKAQRDQRIIPAVTSVRLPDGRMQSKPLHDMFPYLPPGEVEAELRAARSDE